MAPGDNELLLDSRFVSCHDVQAEAFVFAKSPNPCYVMWSYWLVCRCPFDYVAENCRSPGVVWQVHIQINIFLWRFIDTCVGLLCMRKCARNFQAAQVCRFLCTTPPGLFVQVRMTRLQFCRFGPRYIFLLTGATSLKYKINTPLNVLFT